MATSYPTSVEIDPADEALANDILQPLDSKKLEWQNLPMEKRKQLLTDIGERVTAWGFSYDWGLAQMKSRKIEPVADGAHIAGSYGIVPALIVKRAVDTLLKGLDESISIPRVDFLKEYGVDTSATGYLTEVDGITGQRTILFTEGDSRREAYRTDRAAEIVVILAAGNQTFLAVLDALYYLFVERHVCVIKHHPLQLPAKPHIDRLLEPLLRAGFLASVDASPSLARALVHSPLVAAAHLTGGIATHDALVWGADAHAARRRADGRPLLRARMLSELGCVTPYIILPGPPPPAGAPPAGDDGWSDAAIARHAAAAAVGLADNSSCNCLATKMILLPAEFPALADRFCAAFRRAVAATRPEPAWYPGMRERYAKWRESVTRAGATVEVLDAAAPKAVGSLVSAETAALPFALADLGTVSAEDAVRLDRVFADVAWTREEPFAPVCCVLRVGGATLEAYAAAAFALADRQLFGNLSCSVYAPDAAVPLALRAAADKTLRYGTVAINTPTFLCYKPAGYWGGPRGVNSLADAQSGVGNVCNMLMFDSARSCAVVCKFDQAPPGQLPIGAWVSKLLSRLICLGWRGLLPW